MQVADQGVQSVFWCGGILFFISPTDVTCIDMLIDIRTPPPNANNDRAQEVMTPAQDTTHHTRPLPYIIYRPDDEISTSTTHKQYLVS